jgi:hypothetical protein
LAGAALRIEGPKAAVAAAPARKRRREKMTGFCMVICGYVAWEAFLSNGYVSDFVLTS